LVGNAPEERYPNDSPRQQGKTQCRYVMHIV
jgi:hypothetical protein